ncbi:hypothetical protein STXM2123_182 [Streptomyces sp. F-3]|nr:hypothetical protein STXM2123_182 [Streptomyces sp. F-3]
MSVLSPASGPLDRPRACACRAAGTASSPLWTRTHGTTADRLHDRPPCMAAFPASTPGPSSPWSGQPAVLPPHHPQWLQEQRTAAGRQQFGIQGSTVLGMIARCGETRKNGVKETGRG